MILKALNPPTLPDSNPYLYCQSFRSCLNNCCMVKFFRFWLISFRSEQLGFRKRHTLLVRVISKFSIAGNKKLPITAVLLDFSKTFNNVYYEGLFYKFSPSVVHFLRSISAIASASTGQSIDLVLTYATLPLFADYVMLQRQLDTPPD